MTTMKWRPRIAIGGILTECNHFGGLPIDLKTYEEKELLRGEEVLSCDTSVVGGMPDALRAESAAPVPLLYATACAGGPIVAACYPRLRGELLDGLRKALPCCGENAVPPWLRFEKPKRPCFPADPDVPGMEPVVPG